MTSVRDEVDRFANATLAAHVADTQALSRGQCRSMMDPGNHTALFASLMWLLDARRQVVPAFTSRIKKRKITSVPPRMQTIGDGCFALHVTGDLLPHVRWMLIYNVHQRRAFDVPERFTAGNPGGLSLTEPCGMLRAVTNPTSSAKGRALYHFQLPIHQPLTALLGGQSDPSLPGDSAEGAGGARPFTDTQEHDRFLLVQLISYGLAHAPYLARKAPLLRLPTMSRAQTPATVMRSTRTQPE